MATIIDGTAVAARERERIAREVGAFEAEHGRPPGLATVLVGDDPASAVYVGGKERACAEVGMASKHQHLPGDIDQAGLLRVIASLSADETVDGILVQAPLPGQLAMEPVIYALPPEKDVDGFHPLNVGALASGAAGLAQCTPAGIIRLLDAYELPIAGRHAVVVGRSNLVGRPLSRMLLDRDATVTVAHSRTSGLAEHTRSAEILVTAVGQPGLITADMVAPGCVVIDVGITRAAGGLAGDVDFDGVKEVASHITPVPGGVGPMTVVMVLDNTLTAARRRVSSRA